MKFYGISKEELNHLRDGMSILGRVMDVEEFHPYLYVLVEDGETLDSARNAVQGDRPSQVAVAISISSDTLHFLLGSGVYLETEEFAYMTGQGEGSRLGELTGRCKLFINEITQMAVASDSVWIGEFLDSQAPETPAQQEPNIQRTAPASQEPPETPSQEPNMTPQSSESKTASVPGFERVLIGDEPLTELKVTQIIEISDYVEDHQRGSGRYLHAEWEGREWLVYSLEPSLGKQNLTRIIKNKYGLDDTPEVNVLTAAEVSDVMEGVVEEKL